MMVNNKIKIAVSSCLLGEAVRYDGTDKHIEYITKQLTNEYTLISLCPEMAVGMGVPRPSIRLVDDGTTIQARGIENPENNVTKLLVNYAENVIENNTDICGYIFKKNSPSCGTKNVKVLNSQGQYEMRGKGMYAQTIMTASPSLPVIDEEDFLNKSMRVEFLSKVIKYAEINS